MSNIKIQHNIYLEILLIWQSTQNVFLYKYVTFNPAYILNEIHIKVEPNLIKNNIPTFKFDGMSNDWTIETKMHIKSTINSHISDISHDIFHAFNPLISHALFQIKQKKTITREEECQIFEEVKLKCA